MRALNRLVIIAILAVGATAAVAVPVWAHSDDGVMNVDVTPVDADNKVRVNAALRYANDNDPAEDATVTATGSRADGATAGPVGLDHIGLGGYEGEMELPGPGSWGIDVDASEPTASGSFAVEVSGVDTTTPPDDQNASDTSDASEADAAGEEDGTVGGDDTALQILLVAIAIMAIAASVAILRVRRSRRRSDV